ncbi:hypothetical protein AAIR98_001152 [Elusimicrobium simillimum]|uniref:DUF885 family protein n=1 Tax=Elusimicrobium simillimum TaxID=3143438 RepID=UPI003C6EAF90
MKKLYIIMALMLCAVCVPAQTLDKEINSLMGKYALFEVTNSYFTMLDSLYPEQATRAGLETSGLQLNDRTTKTDEKRREALADIKNMIGKVKYKKLTPAEKIDYEIIRRSVDYENYLLNKNLNSTSPMYYLEAQDAVYDLLLKKINSLRQFKDVQPRLAMLPDTFIDGVTNIKTVDKQEAALAVNKAYAAFMSMSDYQNFLRKNADDAIDRARLDRIMAEESAALRQFFNYIKALEKTAKPTKKNDAEYRILLKNKLHIDKPLSDLNKMTEAALAKSKNNFAIMIKAFTGKDAVKISDFYTLAAKNNTAPKYERLLTTIGDEIENANKALNAVLPGSEMKVFVNHMPKYPSFLNPSFLFLPPYGVEHNLIGTLFIYTPNNAKERNAHIKRNFNMSRIKLLVTESVVPGRQMFYSYSYETKPIRRVLSSDAMVDGWAAYAKHLAYETGYLNTKDDALLLAYDDYVRAVVALADIKFNTNELDYDETVLFLNSQGLDKEDAERYTKHIAFKPGQKVAELVAFEEIKAQRKKFENLFGETFSLPRFHDKLFAIGKVPVHMLGAELEQDYKKDRAAGLYMPKADL